MQTTMPELATEFEVTAIELTYLPDRQQALENMTERSDSPAVAALVNALRQTEKYGTPLAGSLRILSQEFRQTRASKAEEKGARMPALMTVPLMVFILPTLITVLIAPAINLAPPASSSAISSSVVLTLRVRRIHVPQPPHSKSPSASKRSTPKSFPSSTSE